MMHKDFLLGNGAIAIGLLEAGCEIVTAYPGTPSSEIVPEVVRLAKNSNLDTYVEWSTNEKVAFDNAFAASITGKRAACCMKQVGLNVASDSLMSSAYLGTKGGFIIISCDDPGPHSSQTEQDSRLMARLAKIPVFDPSIPNEAKEMIKYAFEISEEFEIPIIVRPTTRVCHTRELIKWRNLKKNNKLATFIKNPNRWAATPKYRLKQHEILNFKLSRISIKFNELNLFNNHNLLKDKKYSLGIISSGVPSAIVSDIFREKNRTDIPLLKLGSPYPLPWEITNKFMDKCENILVIEETDLFIEYFLNKRNGIYGRKSGHVPSEGELLPEKIENILNNLLIELHQNPLEKIKLKSLDILKKIKIEGKKPSLCAGCPHRASFYAIRKSEPKAIFTSDIGCYTLGINMGGVDTCVDMGAAITIASGFYHSFKKNNIYKPIIATMGDSTFIHSGVPGLLNSIYNNARFVLVILDNRTIAMTGMQPSPSSGMLANGNIGNSISIGKIVEGCGITFIKKVDPYDVSNMIKIIKEALHYTSNPDGGIAVVIARHPCLVAFKYKKNFNKYTITVNDNCNSCNFCYDRFQCPALYKDSATGKTLINDSLCTKCGVCIDICTKKAINKKIKSVKNK